MLSQSTIREAKINQHISNLFREQDIKLNNIGNSINDTNKLMIGKVKKYGDKLFEIEEHVLEMIEMLSDGKYRGPRELRRDYNSNTENASYWNI